MHGLGTPVSAKLEPPLHVPIAGHPGRKSRDSVEVTLKFRNEIPRLPSG